MSFLLGGLFQNYDQEINSSTSTEQNINGVINYPQFLEMADNLKSSKWNHKVFCQGLLKKLQTEQNGNVIINTLSLIDTCVKNAGQGFHIQFVTREMVDQLRAFITHQDPLVTQKAKESIQTWALLLKNNPEMFLLTDLYESLKRIGVTFPTVSVPISSALVETTLAPPWIDSETCSRCRTAFTTFNRKHHCRNCGNVFCHGIS
jgi:growth factor-regulated tyrosine kinase substrate